MAHSSVSTLAGLAPKVIRPIDRYASGRQLMPGATPLRRIDYPATRAGRGYLADSVTINGAGVRRRVLCLEAATGRLVGSTWSSTAGAYRFDGLSMTHAYLVLAVDHENQYSPVGKAPLYPTRYE